MKVTTMEDLLAAQRAFKERDELSSLEEQLRDVELTPKEQYAEALKGDRKVNRLLKERGSLRRKPKSHWKTRQKKRREYNREVAGPRRKERLGILLEEKGWYPIVRDTWVRKKVDIQLSEEEWNEEIEPLLEGYQPLVTRVDTSEGVSLDNVVVLDSKTRKVLYDGLERKMRNLRLYTVAKKKAPRREPIVKTDGTLEGARNVRLGGLYRSPCR